MCRIGLTNVSPTYIVPRATRGIHRLLLVDVSQLDPRKKRANGVFYVLSIATFIVRMSLKIDSK